MRSYGNFTKIFKGCFVVILFIPVCFSFVSNCRRFFLLTAYYCGLPRLHSYHFILFLFFSDSLRINKLSVRIQIPINAVFGNFNLKRKVEKGKESVKTFYSFRILDGEKRKLAIWVLGTYFRHYWVRGQDFLFFGPWSIFLTILLTNLLTLLVNENDETKYLFCLLLFLNKTYGPQSKKYYMIKFSFFIASQILNFWKIVQLNCVKLWIPKPKWISFY